MISKKAQSEVITTVLIILLVLAAIIIVWLVVQNTINNGKTGIEKGTACMGIQTDIVSAFSGDVSGTCSVGTCSTRSTCAAAAAAGGCAGVWTGKPYVVVQRNSGSATSAYPILKATLYIDGQNSGLNTTALSPMSTYKFDTTNGLSDTVVGVTKLSTSGQKVKAVTFLSNTAGDTVACPIAIDLVAQ